MEFEQYLSTLPTYDFAITYGSGVFKQVGYSEKEHKNAMLDVIIGVKDPEKWHEQNIQRNPDHYSFARHLGATQVSKMESWGLGHVYYNRTTMGPKKQERPVKYGVISLSDLEKDLKEWDSLYVAGRLHKPVRILRANSSIINEMNTNLYNAVISVLPLLSNQFTDKDLFLAITGLSYNGDIRTWFAENPNKVRNIVDGNYHHFKELYKSVIEQCPFIRKDEYREGVYHQLLSISNLAQITSMLPASLHPFIREELQFCCPPGDVNALPRDALEQLYESRLHVLYDREGKNHNVIPAKAAIARGINNGVRHAVFRSSVDQAIRGNMSFGVLNSLSYVTKKIKKFLK